MEMTIVKTKDLKNYQMVLFNKKGFTTLVLF
jgi:hypothetical protein